METSPDAPYGPGISSLLRIRRQIRSLASQPVDNPRLTDAGAASRARDVVFISHANPEDNRFAVWLALQLVREGYKVWCDETKLLCGDDMWSEIEAIIRHEAAKFIFVGSRSSNQKPGVLKELHLATVVERTNKLDDFVLPVIIDDLPFSDLNIEVTRLLAASFREGWPKGLAQIIARLEKDEVPRSGPGPGEMARWWCRQNGALSSVVPVAETCPTNWFPIRNLPRNLVIAHPSNRAAYLGHEQAYPVVRFGEGVASLSPRLQPMLRDYGTASTVGHADENGVPRRRINGAIVELLRVAWERICRTRGLHEHSLSQRRRCFVFLSDQIPGDQVTFTDPEGKTRRRNIVGYKTVGERKRWWHLAVEARPIVMPVPALAIRLHILFSDDGKKIWDSDKRLHAARRSQGRSWWNDDWRDRGRGVMAWLAGNAPVLSLPIGADQVLEVDTVPLFLVSPVSYSTPKGEEVEPPLDADESDILEDDDEAEDVA